MRSGNPGVSAWANDLRGSPNLVRRAGEEDARVSTHLAGAGREYDGAFASLPKDQGLSVAMAERDEGS